MLIFYLMRRENHYSGADSVIFWSKEYSEIMNNKPYSKNKFLKISLIKYKRAIKTIFSFNKTPELSI